ncbi:MAG: LysM peptidoglycan-binding domain-containing protein [Thermoflexibacter sp.]|jgi:membrane-bound lytic murein transglycosylase D|nr:LysM peptidoglycan-binding domain-containing protein [Thermoflexibacter sp.]
MTKYILFTALVLTFLPSKAILRPYDVPSEMQFAGIRLLIDNEAREMIQEKADEYTKKSFYHACVSRARLYFPLIENALANEQVPSDIKYLSLQTSYLLSTLGTPDGVGFWQISDTLALQMGMTVNEEVDERRHIIISSEFIAKHLRDKNYLLRNWIYTVMSYRMGLIDAVNQIDKNLIGATQLQITQATPKSILNLLAYVIAYKDEIERENSTMELLAYHNTKGKSLEDIAKFTKIPFDQIKEYNRWLIASEIPSYKTFPVILPVLNTKKEEVSRLISPLANNESVLDTNKRFYPILMDKTIKKFRDKNYTFAKANGLKAMIGDKGDRVADMADAADINPDKFRLFNDMTDFDDIKEGQVYYLERKNKKTDAKEHVLDVGESFWDVSQRYGLRLSTLIGNNRLSEKDTAKVGRVVWLNSRRPEDKPIEYRALVQNPIFSQPDNTITEVPDSLVNKATEVAKKEVNIPQKINLQDTIYTAQAGETIIDVYKKTNVPLDNLIAWNDLKNTDLAEGQQIRLKPPVQKTAEVNNKGTLPSNPNTNPVNTATEVPHPDEVAMTTPDNTSAQIVPDEHQVQKGETVSAIANKYKLKVADLKKWNGLDEKGAIKVGQKLKLKEPAANAYIPEVKADTSEVVHTVQDKETLFGIAKKYNISIAEIAKNNSIDEKTPVIKKGQKLTIKRRTAPRTNTPQLEDKSEQTINPTTNLPINKVEDNSTQVPVNQTQTTPPQETTKTGLTDDGINMPYVRNPTASGNDIIEVNPDLDHFDNILKRYPYGDKQDLANWNGLTIDQILNGTIPNDRRTLVVSQKGYEESLKYGTVIYPTPKIVNQPQQTVNQQNTINNPQQGTGYQPPVNVNNPQQGTISQTGNPNNTGTGETKRIQINPFSDNFFKIKAEHNITDEEIARLNNIPIDVVKGGSIPLEITELIVSGSPAQAGGTGTQGTGDVSMGTGTMTNPMQGSTTTIPLDQAILHSANQGDNIYKLAKMYNTQPDSIIQWNNIQNEKINFGQQLIVGRKPPISMTPLDNTQPPNFHILQKGETLYSISKRYNVDMSLLIENNPKIFKDKIVRNGDTVFLKKIEKVIIPAPQTANSMDEGYYIVQEGDDMYKISERFKIKPSDLKLWNKLAPGVGVTKPIPTGTKLVIDADLAEALKNQNGQLPKSSMDFELVHHFVSKGETLSAIAKKYDTEVNTLKELNDKPEGNIREGEKLLVGKIFYHTVTKGETLSVIARKYNLSNEQLKTLNKKKDDVVKEGEKLVIGK